MTEITLDNPVGEKFIFDWQYDILGGFMQALATAIRKADLINTHRLAMGFPDQVRAYKDFSQTEGWWEVVRAKHGHD